MDLGLQGHTIWQMHQAGMEFGEIGELSRNRGTVLKIRLLDHDHSDRDPGSASRECARQPDVEEQRSLFLVFDKGRGVKAFRENGHEATSHCAFAERTAQVA